MEGAVDNARMRQITGGHAAEMTQVLQGLVSKQALTQEGQGRWTRYRLPVRPDSLHKNEKPDPDAGRSEDEWEQLRTIAAAVLKKRRSPQETEQLILKLCRGRWLSRNQLAELLVAELLGRNPEGGAPDFLCPWLNTAFCGSDTPTNPTQSGRSSLYRR